MRATSIMFSLFMAACRIGFDEVDPDTGDQGPDAGLIETRCSAAGVTCVGDAVRSCTAPNATPSVEPCAWGCVAGGAAHCGVLDPVTFPSAGLTTPTAPLADLVLGGVWITSVGALTSETGPFSPPLHGAFEGEQNGVDFRIHGGIGVYRVQSLHITGPLHLSAHDWGSTVEPIAIFAAGPIVIDGVIDGQSACNSDDQAAPGGFLGNLNTDPSGHAPSTQTAGGGGGGNGGTGGAAAGAGGQPLTSFGGLVGGGGGGGSGSSSIHHGVGGAGGAALQLISNTSITINQTGGINAGGCGGYVGDYQHGGGGGGAGGTLVLQAPAITIAGTLAVNGGAGANASTRGGDNGLLGRAAATGGGGAGGFAGSPNGASAPSAATGGGGAAGRMRFETRHGDVAIDASAVLSPGLTDAWTTTIARAAIVW